MDFMSLWACQDVRRLCELNVGLLCEVEARSDAVRVSWTGCEERPDPNRIEQKIASHLRTNQNGNVH